MPSVVLPRKGSGRFLLRAQSAPGRWRISASSITNALAASSPRRNEGQRGRDPSPSMAQVIAKKESAHPGKLLIFTRGTAHTGTPFFPWLTPQAFARRTSGQVADRPAPFAGQSRSEEHTSEL